MLPISQSRMSAAPEASELTAAAVAAALGDGAAAERLAGSLPFALPRFGAALHVSRDGGAASIDVAELYAWLAHGDTRAVLESLVATFTSDA